MLFRSAVSGLHGRAGPYTELLGNSECPILVRTALSWPFESRTFSLRRQSRFLFVCLSWRVATQAAGRNDGLGPPAQMSSCSRCCWELGSSGPGGAGLRRFTHSGQLSRNLTLVGLWSPGVLLHVCFELSWRARVPATSALLVPHKSWPND